jgi:AraC-like DNA-binding protein
MRYCEIKTRFPLNRFVECFWTLESDEPSVQPERILPDGCVELILNFGARFSQHDQNTCSLQPRNFLVGQITGPIFISPTGTVQSLGIRFQPAGTLPFLRVPLNEITDRVVELGGLSSKLERDLLNAADTAESLSQKVTAVEKFLSACLLNNQYDLRLIQLAATIVASAGLTPVDQLARDAGVSGRQLERRFLRDVGINPKLLGRIIRFQQVFRAVEECSSVWAAVAVECGYYDQSHLIRDFNQFAQQSPAALFSNQSPLTESFTRKTRASDFYNTIY